jgi:hypothetical protein
MALRAHFQHGYSSKVHNLPTHRLFKDLRFSAEDGYMKVREMLQDGFFTENGKFAVE